MLMLKIKKIVEYKHSAKYSIYSNAYKFKPGRKTGLVNSWDQNEIK